MARRVWTVVFSAAILFQAASRVGAQTVSLTVTPTATAPATTKYAYVVVVKTSQKLTIVSVEQANNAGPATLSAAEYVDVTWTYTPSADTGSVASIDIYRTAGGATQGKIASYGAGATTLRDNGLTGDKSKVPAASVLPPIVTPVPAGGMTSYGYVVVARTVQGGVSVGPKGTSSTGPETLSLTATNRVQWPAIPGTDAYDVYRVSGGPSTTTGLIATVKDTGVANAQYGIVDTGATGRGTVPSAGAASGDAPLPGAPSLNLPLFEGMRVVAGTKGPGPKPAAVVAYVTLADGKKPTSEKVPDLVQPIATTKDIQDDGSFMVNLLRPLAAGQQVYACARGGDEAAFSCHDSVVVQTPDDWGRVRAYFAAGVVFSKQNGDFSKTDPVVSFTIDKVWWMRDPKPLSPCKPTPQPAPAEEPCESGKILPQSFNTFFDVRLTSVGVSTSPTMLATADAVLESKKAAILQGGAYLPLFQRTWTWQRDGERNAIFLAPVFKVGIQTADVPNITGAANPSGVYKFWGVGFGVGHETLSGSRDSAPSVISYMHITFGRFENYDPDKIRAAVEGRLKIPMTPLQIGVDANIPFHLADPADLRFILGTRFDIGVLFGKLKLIGG